MITLYQKVRRYTLSCICLHIVYMYIFYMHTPRVQTTATAWLVPGQTTGWCISNLATHWGFRGTWRLGRDSAETKPKVRKTRHTVHPQALQFPPVPASGRLDRSARLRGRGSSCGSAQSGYIQHDGQGAQRRTPESTHGLGFATSRAITRRLRLVGSCWSETLCSWKVPMLCLPGRKRYKMVWSQSSWNPTTGGGLVFCFE